MTVSKFNNMSTEQLLHLIAEYRLTAETNFKEICLALVEVKRRAEPHNLFRDKLFRWYAEVAAEKLHPGIVFHWDGNRQKMECFIGRPLERQLAVLQGREIGIVEEVNGEMLESRKKIISMSPKELRRVFPKGEDIRTFDEQREILQAEIAARVPKTETVPEVKGDVAARVLRVGKHAIPLALVKAALAEIGLTVTGEGYESA